jgi:26S proteasome regulatory subunit N1
MERGEHELSQPFAKYFCLGIGLVFLGQQDKVQTALDIIEGLVQPPLNKFALVVANACAYAGSGSVLKLQEMLKIVSEHLEESENSHQVPAVLACALIAMGEDIGSDMILRSFDHVLQYGELNVKRITPLAMALLCIGNPKITLCDILIKLAFESDPQLA